MLITRPPALISRRDMLRIATTGAALTGAVPALAGGSPSLYPAVNPRGWPVLQGPTDRTSTSLIVVLPHGFESGVRVDGPDGSPLPWRIVERLDLPDVRATLTEIEVTGLTPECDNVLYLLGPDGGYFDRRIFRALDTSRAGCRFAVVCCMDDSYVPQRVTMWETLARTAPDFVVFLGDTTYADHNNTGTTEAAYARRYVETRTVLSWFNFERLVPCFATWDDHDFGRNNADRTFRYGSFTQQLFQSFWGRRANAAWQPTFGVGSRLEAFGQRFYLMDNRSFRDPPEIAGTHWGTDQMAWLLADLARSPEPAWLMSGSQFFGGYLGVESMEGDYSGDFAALTETLRSIAAPVTFVSGDVHFSELMRIEPQVLGYTTYEFTSGAMHSLTFPGQHLRRFNPRRLDATWRFSFMLFDVSAADGWSISARCVLNGPQVAFERQMQIRR